MSQYLRDKFLKNLSLVEDSLIKINQDLVEIKDKANQIIQQRYAGNQAVLSDKTLSITYVIRFDGKGFKLFEFEKALKYFQDAHRVERVIITLDSRESIQSNRLNGHCAEVWLDVNEPSRCMLSVQADDQDWLDLTFNRLEERLCKYKNNNHLVRNRFMDFAIQLIGVFAGIVLSLWLSIKISPKLTIESAFAFTFIIALLLFSNCWTAIRELIYRLINYYWPNISFKKKGGAHWLVKSLISTVFVGFIISIFIKLFAYIVAAVRSILK